MMPAEQAPSGIDTSRPNVARVYNYLIGGKDHYAADRMAGDAMLEQEPDAKLSGTEHRAFLRRVVRYLAAEAGVRQFIDVGSGLPVQGNTHEVAQEAAPDARVVYVDNDPVVVVHARALISPAATTRIIDADVREPGAILDSAREFLDFSQPVAVLLLAILHHIADDEDPGTLAAAFRDAIVPGSYLAISHFCNPGPAFPEDARIARESERVFAENLGTGRFRSPEEIGAFFGDFRLADPGLVPLTQWRPDTPPEGEPLGVFRRFLGGVALKP
jgi:hypothetical protein